MCNNVQVRFLQFAGDLQLDLLGVDLNVSLGRPNELKLLNSHKQNSNIVKSKNGAAKSNERMFMPLHHVMHARSFEHHAYSVFVFSSRTHITVCNRLRSILAGAECWCGLSK